MCLQRWVGALTPIFPQNHDGENPVCGGSPTVPFPLFPQVVLGTAVGLVSGGDASHPHLAGCCCGCSRFGSSADALPLPPSLSEFSLAQHWDEKLFFLSSKQALRDVHHALGAFLETNAFPWSVALRVFPVPELFQVSVSKSDTMSWVLVFLQGFCPCCSLPLGREECDSVPGLKGKVGLGRAVEQEALGTANIYRT